MEKDKDFEQMALEEVVYGNQHTISILLELLIDKGIITEQEFKDKLDEMIERSQDVEELQDDS